jgi:hydrogenase maturation protease
MVLIAGIGNIFLGDDGFGSEVARHLANRVTWPGVRIVDFGIRGLDFAYALLDGYEATIIVDATCRGGQPGTIYVIEPDLNEPHQAHPTVEAHAMDPVRVLALARSMGAELKNIRIIGCEPATFGADEGHIGLSPPVAAAIEPAVQAIESLIAAVGVREAIL